MDSPLQSNAVPGTPSRFAFVRTLDVAGIVVTKALSIAVEPFAESTVPLIDPICGVDTGSPDPQATITTARQAARNARRTVGMNTRDVIMNGRIERLGGEIRRARNIQCIPTTSIGLGSTVMFVQHPGVLARSHHIKRLARTQRRNPVIAQHPGVEPHTVHGTDESRRDEFGHRCVQCPIWPWFPLLRQSSSDRRLPEGSVQALRPCRSRRPVRVSSPFNASTYRSASSI